MTRMVSSSITESVDDARQNWLRFAFWIVQALATLLTHAPTPLRIEAMAIGKLEFALEFLLFKISRFQNFKKMRARAASPSNRGDHLVSCIQNKPFAKFISSGFVLEFDSGFFHVWSFLMSKTAMRIPPALKHGCYSSLGLLPTEDRAAFDKLQRDLIAEYQPVGRSEEIIVASLAHFMWRRENLATYRLAEYAKNRQSAIYSKLGRRYTFETIELGLEPETRSPEQLKALRKEADEQAERELGPVQELIDLGNVVTSDNLLKELALVERLDGMIARCLKQLVLVRGVKSISPPASAELLRPRITKAA